MFILNVQIGIDYWLLLKLVLNMVHVFSEFFFSLSIYYVEFSLDDWRPHIFYHTFFCCIIMISDLRIYMYSYIIDKNKT